MFHQRIVSPGLVFSLAVVSCIMLAGLAGCEKADDQEQAEAPPPPGPMPNIVFVLIDTLRADALGIYGNPYAGTPAIDSVAAEGAVFHDAITAAPWTQPAMASLFCSRYPGAHGVTDYRLAFKAIYKKERPAVAVLSDTFATLAESLQERGYATAGFSANPFITEPFGFAQGFEHFDSSFAENTTPGSVVNEAALAWLRNRDPNTPFFVYLHYMDPHGPYEAAPEVLDPLLDRVEQMPDKRVLTPKELETLAYLRRPPKGATDIARHNRLSRYQEYWAARYEAGVRLADRYLGELRASLTEMGLWDDAYVILTADHGEALCEHGFWEHGFSTHHTDLHVPLILRWPGQVRPGRRVYRTVRLIDLMPTMLDQLKLPAPDGMQGSSLAAHLAGRPPSESTIAYAEAVKRGPNQRAVYLDGWKLIFTPRTGRRQLYHLAQDPFEQTDLASLQPERVGELAMVIQRQVAENKQLLAGLEVQRATLTEAQRKRLESIGYTGEGDFDADSPDAPNGGGSP